MRGVVTGHVLLIHDESGWYAYANGDTVTRNSTEIVRRMFLEDPGIREAIIRDFCIEIPDPEGDT